MWQSSIGNMALPSVQVKRPQLIPRADEQILRAVNRVGLRCVADVADTRVPEWLAVFGIVGDQVAAAVAAEKKSPGCSEEADSAATAVRVFSAPRDFARCGLDGRQKLSSRTHLDAQLPPQTH